LRARLAESLPEHMLPTAFVHLERLPLLPSGKLDRRQLPDPEAQAYASPSAEEPQGEIEAQVAQLYAELLGAPRVHRHDSFFELGGHSLLAVQLLGRLTQTFAVVIGLGRLFSHPTVASLAECIVDEQLAQFDPEELAELALNTER